MDLTKCLVKQKFDPASGKERSFEWAKDASSSCIDHVDGNIRRKANEVVKMSTKGMLGDLLVCSRDLAAKAASQASSARIAAQILPCFIACSARLNGHSGVLGYVLRE